MNKIPHRYVNKNIEEIQNAVNELISKQGEIIDFINKDCMIMFDNNPNHTKSISASLALSMHIGEGFVPLGLERIREMIKKEKMIKEK